LNSLLWIFPSFLFFSKLEHSESWFSMMSRNCSFCH
jgi:hypothetical protein